MPKVTITSEHPPINKIIKGKFVLIPWESIILLLQSKSYSRKFVESDGGESAKGKMNSYGYFHMKHHDMNWSKIWLSNHTLGLQ
tara:strand:- start:69 stop:320 length:252 start_codon:yes stop_codon:yes gene_type:complete